MKYNIHTERLPSGWSSSWVHYENELPIWTSQDGFPDLYAAMDWAAQEIQKHAHKESGDGPTVEAGTEEHGEG